MEASVGRVRGGRRGYAHLKPAPTLELTIARLVNKPRHTEGNIKKTFGLIRLNAKTSMSIERLRRYEEWTDVAYSRMNKGRRNEKVLNKEYADTKHEIKDAFERFRTAVDEKGAAGSVAGVGGIGAHTKKVKEVLD